MDTYYEEILKEVNKLIAAHDYKEAYAILEDELAMPYIPMESESAMIALYNECRSELQLNKVERNYDDEDIEQLLMGSLEEQLMAVELLKKSNLRQHVKEVEQCLCANPHILVRSLLIEAMMDQNIAEEIHMTYEEMEITFLPCYIEAPMKAEGAVIAVNLLCDWWENEDPTFLKMCIDSLIKELYLRLPFNLEEDEGLPMAMAIVEYVCMAGNDKETYTIFKEAKQLTHEHGFELLLCKHHI